MTVYDNRDDQDAASGGARSMSDIEDDIRAIRSRMDITLDEIEFRLSPGQMGGGLIETVKDVIQGNDTRVARAIRANPIPVALIGIGALWLAWAVSRTPAVDPMAPPRGTVSDQRVRILLTGLVGACRQGADAFREADAAVADPLLSQRLLEIATQFERSAAALDNELRLRGGMAETDAPLHPAWSGLHDALSRSRDRESILAGLETGMDDTLHQFRDALQEDLTEELQVIVGAHFHDLQTVQHHVGALREAVS